MRLSPREVDHAALATVGMIAQRRLARGLRLNQVEAVGLLSWVTLERIRDGDASVAELMATGREILGLANVMDGVASMVEQVQVEGTFRDGTKLVSIHEPICREHGNMQLALYGSFLPMPPSTAFGVSEDAQRAEQGVAASESATKSDRDERLVEESLDPGAVLADDAAGMLTLNAGRECVGLRVTNYGDRPIQVGSHYHFVETNGALSFDRVAALGMRLNIPAGTAIRFEPGQTKDVALVKIGGRQVVHGGNSLVDGPIKNWLERPAEFVAKLNSRGFRHVESTDEDSVAVPRELRMSRAQYARMFGPTVGDRVQLGDTGLLIRIERDLGVYGEECKFGGGKVIRDGLGQQAHAGEGGGDTRLGNGKLSVLDCVLTGAVVVDYTGIYKADIGVRDGLIVGIGCAGNPDTMDGVSDGMVVGAATEVIAAEGMIVTAGGIDSHVHFICPQQCDEAIASGISTMFGGGSGPATGSLATTCTPGAKHIEVMLRATDALSVNLAFSGKGNCSSEEELEAQVRAGAAGLKVHEDWGATPAVIDAALQVAERMDVQITVHCDTLNESTFVEGSMAAFAGRTIHTYHSEGAGGGHAPDLLRVCAEPNVIPSSTNPTRPYTVNTIDEHLDMLMVCHHLDAGLPEDVAFAESRIRAETIAAEDVLHDMGAISIVSSDSQAMGRVGETITRTWQTAAKNKQVRGVLAEDSDTGADNFRVKRYVAKYTINPAIAHGMSHMVGSVEVGKFADLVVWAPSSFGAKPELVLKGGIIAWAQMGDFNASISTPQPVSMRPMFGATYPASRITFVSPSSIDRVKSYGLTRRVEAVSQCRKIGKKDMKLNCALPAIEVDPETFQVRADGELLVSEPATTLPLTQKYFLF